MNILIHKMISLIWFIVPWLIWWKVYDRTRLFELLTFGFLLSTLAVFLDTMGVYHKWWVYHEKLFNQVPHFVPVDYAALPVGYMLTYQFMESWKRYIICAMLLSATGAYIVEPISIYLEFYEQLKWRHIYSFVIYFLIAVLLKFLLERMKHSVNMSS